MAHDINDIGTGIGFVLTTDEGASVSHGITPNTLTNKFGILRRIKENCFRDNTGNSYYNRKYYLNPVAVYVAGLTETLSVTEVIALPDTEDISDLLTLVGTDLILTSHIKDAQVTLPKMAAHSVDESKILNTTFGAGLTGGSATKVTIDPDNSTVELSGEKLQVKDLGITLVKMAANSVDENKIIATAMGDGLTGGGGAQLAADPDGTMLEIDGGGQIAIKALGVGTTELAANAVTVAKRAAADNEFELQFLISAEVAAGLGAIDLIMPHACEVNRVDFTVHTLIEGSDNLTIHMYNVADALNMTAAPTALAMGSAIGTVVTVAAPFSGSTGTFAQYEKMRFTTAKVTVGGLVLVQVKCTRI